ncbi:hypothetical protein HDU76_004098, partial [Blyttiomyces sp. JEL0837]
AIQIPGLICLAETDFVLPPAKVEIIKNISKEKEGLFEVREYKGNFHGFAVRGKEEDPVIREARDQVLKDMVVFFGKEFSK